jgi:AAT family amino acid transporter
MENYVMKKRLTNPLVSGLVSFVFLFIFASVSWPVWSILAKTFFLTIAGDGLQHLDQHLVAHFLKDAVEGTFFWMSISAWIWCTLVFGNYGKYKKTKQQPQAGIRYSFIAFLAGIGGFIALTGLIGIWWKPFSWSILFRPQTVAELELAIKGWGASNFYVLPVIICQIPITSLFHKYPFSGKIKEPGVGLGSMLLGTLVALIVWFAIFIPSFFDLSFNGELITGKPFGGFTSVVAWCQCFILWFLIPAEGGENFPMKLLSKKQPYMGIAGLVIAFIGSHLTLRGLRVVLNSFAEALNMPIDLVIASFVLSIIVTMLVWHHHFYDFPTQKMQPSMFKRTLARISIWLILGSIVGVIWLKTYTLLPFAGNNFGLGYPMLGVLAGQFVFLMPALFMNTFFDKWPICYCSVEESESELNKAVQAFK